MFTGTYALVGSQVPQELGLQTSLVKTLQSKGVYVLKAQAFPVCDVHWSSHMELKGTFTLMERNNKKNLGTH